MTQRRASVFYALVIAAYVAHFFEEACGGFIAIDRIGGLYVFIAVNLAIFSAAVFILVRITAGKRWALKAGLVFSALMIANGVGHITAALFIGHTIEGIVGHYTGIALIIVGIPAVYFLNDSLRKS